MRTKWNKCCCCFKREIFSHPSSKYYFSCSIFQGLICHVFLFILLNSLSILQAAPELFCCGATQLQMVRNVLSCWKKKQDISRKWHHLHGNKPFVRLSGQSTNIVPRLYGCWLLDCMLIPSWMVPLLCSWEDAVTMPPKNNFKLWLDGPQNSFLLFLSLA